MIILDTDILSLVFLYHSRVMQRVRIAPESPVICLVTRIEVLQGRFDAVLKGADANQVLTAQARLALAEKELAKYTVIPFEDAAGAAFNDLRQEKKLRKIGRKDLLIACIALANRAILVTRNVKDFQLVPGLRLENWAD
jgi:tRNA(fMet)-specific endonuclease VapC